MYVEIDDLTQLAFENMLNHCQLQFLHDIEEILKKNQA